MKLHRNGITRARLVSKFMEPVTNWIAPNFTMHEGVTYLNFDEHLKVGRATNQAAYLQFGVEVAGTTTLIMTIELASPVNLGTGTGSLNIPVG